MLESDTSRFKTIGVSEGRTCYFYSGMLSGSEKSAVEVAKGALLRRLVGNILPSNKSLFNVVREAAKAELTRTYPSGRADYLSYILAHDMAGSGPISMLLEDSLDIEEIEINSPFNISIYHRRFGRCDTNLSFNSIEDFRYAINRMAAVCRKELGEATPILDFQYGNARIHAQLVNFSLNSGVATIRIGGHYGFDAGALLKSRFAEKKAIEYLSSCIASGKNIVIAGAPGTGKTTLLAAISAFLPRDKRIILIEEEINEIRLDPGIKNSITLVSSELKGIGFKEQIRNALHMRPEFIVIGEVRGQEANDVFAGANLGVPFITTMHSNGNGELLLSRLRANPMHVEQWLLRNLDVSVFLSKDAAGVRRIESIVEYSWGKDGLADEIWIVENGAMVANPAQQRPNSAVAGSRIETRDAGKKEYRKRLTTKEVVG